MGNRQYRGVARKGGIVFCVYGVLGDSGTGGYQGWQPRLSRPVGGKNRAQVAPEMRVLDYLTGLPYLPMSATPPHRPTRSEIRRWCRDRSVLLNGCFVQELQEIPNGDCGIWQLVFFPGSDRRRCTMIQVLPDEEIA